MNGETDIQWQESGEAQLGWHRQGFSPVPLTAIYDECSSLIHSHDPRAGRIDLRTDDRNLLQRCTYTPMGCADDCDEGVIINSIEFAR
jgi:hypothetical protein